MKNNYLIVNDDKFIHGQDGKTGMWYCKELHCNSVAESDRLIGKLNKIYNKYNKGLKKENNDNSNTTKNKSAKKSKKD